VNRAEGETVMDDIRITGGAGIAPAVQDVDSLQKQADQEINRVQLQDNGSIHATMIAMEKADLSLRTMIQVRNKVLDAYQEIMRMTV
jgi:flagellar hook-basal body complex protein FliE